MLIYHGTQLIENDADHASFIDLFRQAVERDSSDPFLLIRADDVRMYVVAHEEKLMLCVAYYRNVYETTVESTYWQDPILFQGLRSVHKAKPESFVDAKLALMAISAFFDGKRLADIVHFEPGIADREMLSFPQPIRVRRSGARALYEKRVRVHQELRNDMRSVSELLNELNHEDDALLDSKDAIQFGSLSGYRTNATAELFEFGFAVGDGHIWGFEIDRITIDGLANGSIQELDVIGMERWRSG